MIKLSDVIHLYIGQECMYSRPCSYKKEVIDAFMIKHLNDSGNSWDLCKPILRQISDMTNEDAVNIFRAALNDAYIGDKLAALKHFVFHSKTVAISFEGTVGVITELLKMGFDLFELIKSGQAIDKTKLA